jgi:multicomponent Na+:H+ antiporter subunit D
VVLVLVSVLRRSTAALILLKRVSRRSEFAALVLALSSLLLALAALGPVPGDLVSNPLAPRELATTLLVLVGGTLLALGLSRRSLLTTARADAGANGGPLRRAAVAAGVAFEHADLLVRRWPFASIALLSLAALFGGLLLVGAPK